MRPASLTLWLRTLRYRCVPETRGKTLEQIERELDLLALSKSSAKLKPRYPARF